MRCHVSGFSTCRSDIPDRQEALVPSRITFKCLYVVVPARDPDVDEFFILCSG